MAKLNSSFHKQGYTMSWKDHVGGPFSFQTAPFGIHPKDDERAFALLEELRAADASWEEVNLEFRNYLKSQNVHQTFLEEQMLEVEKHYRPWLRF